MFWILVLAHLTADYPLQTDRMVLAKKKMPGLLLHVGVHLVVMLVFFIPVLSTTWYFLVVVAIAHLFIDAFKNFLGRKRPQWIVGPYIFDQVLHFSSLILVSSWMANTTDLPVWPVVNPWAVYVSGAMTATYIWFITERIVEHKSDNRQIKLMSTMWPRMGARLLLFILVAAPNTFAIFLAFWAVVLIVYLYRRFNYLRSWMIFDVGVGVISGLIVRIIFMIW